MSGPAAPSAPGGARGDPRRDPPSLRAGTDALGRSEVVAPPTGFETPRQSARRSATNQNWAVAETRRLVEHARAVRSPERVGERTYRDLAARVRAKRERYPEIEGGVGERTLADVEGAVSLPAFVAATAEHTDDGRPVTARDGVACVDVVYRLRRRGYADRGNPGTPVFEPAGGSTPW